MRNLETIPKRVLIMAVNWMFCKDMKSTTNRQARLVIFSVMIMDQGSNERIVIREIRSIFNFSRCSFSYIAYSLTDITSSHNPCHKKP